jgi:hypothetical protein
MVRCAALALGLCFSWLALVAASRAEDPFADSPAQDKAAPASKDSPDPEREAAIREALKRPTQMEFTETPLQDAVDFLKDYHGIEIQLDNRALENEDIGSDSPITRHVRGMSLASALRLLLNDIDATFVVRDGTLLITTRRAAAHMTDLRVYAINELVGDGVEPVKVAEVLRSALASGCAVPQDQAAAKGPAIADPSPTNATMVPFRNLLVIRATLQDHDEIQKLLAEFKAKLKAGE